MSLAPGHTLLFLLILLLAMPIPVSRPAVAAQLHRSAPEDHETGQRDWYSGIEMEWGGYIKTRGSASHPDDASIYALVGTGTYLDGGVEGRVKNRLFLEDWGTFETHYEMVLSGGDTRSKNSALGGFFPGLDSFRLPSAAQLEDDRRLMDLTAILSESDDYILYHRLDRLFLKMSPRWGILSLGRQAITWGNGLLFNPMDLFNPFAPTDIERDYKVGDDMLLAQVTTGPVSNIQALCVPRRDPASGDLEADQSSLAAKYHFSRGTWEFDVMAAEHYGDHLAGIGGSGYVGAAAWRFDAVLTIAGESDGKDALSLAANVDYSWVWRGMNFYGFLEAFYNGFGTSNYTAALADPEITGRLERGELFTLGRLYAAGHVRAELHPLLNVYLTVITNLLDPSAIFQPRAVWDLSGDLQLTAGAYIGMGGPGTEYGGFPAPGSSLLLESPPAFFLWMSWYF